MSQENVDVDVDVDVVQGSINAFNRGDPIHAGR
jgi:hypothetical protein